MQSPGSSTSGAIPKLKLFRAVRVRYRRKSGRAGRAIGAAESDPQPTDHSPFMFASLMIGHHLSISARCKAASASGVCRSRG